MSAEEINTRYFLTQMNLRPLAPLGDSALKYPEILSEAEINAIHFVVAAFSAECRELLRIAGPGYRAKHYEHYGPTLTLLSERLAKWDGREPPVAVEKSQPEQAEKLNEAKCK